MEKTRVLVVGGDQREVTRGLDRLGYEVSVVAASAEEALGAATGWQPDVVLMDFKAGGLEAALRLRAGLDVPVILMGETASAPDLDRLRLAGVSGWIGRPIAGAELACAIETAMGRKQLERKLYTGEALLTAILRGVSDGVIATDADGRIEFLNPAAERLTGWPQAEALGRPLADVFRLVDERTQGVDLAAPHRAALLSRTGVEMPIEHQVTPLGVQEQVSGSIVIFRDAFDHRAHDEHSQTEKMEATSRLAGGVAHDFNNLLTVILGYSEDLLCRLTDRDFEQVLEIKNAALLATSVTRQLLTFSRKQVVQPRLLNLNDSLNDLSKVLRTVLGESSSLTTVLEPRPWLVKADPGQIEQLIMNLIRNAHEAMPEGGHLVLETANVDAVPEGVFEPPAKAGPYVRLSIRDTGHGMTAETLARIFDPFFTTKKKGRGTGLGLSIVHGIVAQCGGAIRVESEVGHGTGVHIFLPRAVETHEPLRLPKPPREWLPDKQTILLVEDEARVRRLLHNVFEKKGFNLLEAEDGEEALIIAELHEGSIHLLVTDVVMPGISGPELARRLLKLRPEMGVLLISGYTFDAFDQEGWEGAPPPFLAKPFSADELLEKVREILADRARCARVTAT